MAESLIRRLTSTEVPFTEYQDLCLFYSVKNAGDMLGADLKGPAIRAIHDKVELVAANTSMAFSPIGKITAFEIISRTWQKPTAADIGRLSISQDNPLLSYLIHRVQQARNATGLTLTPDNFFQRDLFPHHGLALTVTASGPMAPIWNKGDWMMDGVANPYYPDYNNEQLRQLSDYPVTLAVSLARILFPTSEYNTVKASMIPLISFTQSGAVLHPIQKPIDAEICPAHNVITTIAPPRFYRPLRPRS